MVIRILMHRLREKYRFWKRLSSCRYSADFFRDVPYCHFGRYTYGIPEIARYGDEHLRVGSFVSIAKDVTILLGGNHGIATVSCYDWHAAAPDLSNARLLPWNNSKGDTLIGNDVWIGRGAMVLSGIHIGDGAVIGAGAVVSKDVPPYAVAAGNPIRVLRYRFDQDVIRALLEIQWWNWPDGRIDEMIPRLAIGGPEELIEACLGEDWRNRLGEG